MTTQGRVRFPDVEVKDGIEINYKTGVITLRSNRGYDPDKPEGSDDARGPDPSTWHNARQFHKQNGVIYEVTDGVRRPARNVNEELGLAFSRMERINASRVAPTDEEMPLTDEEKRQLDLLSDAVESRESTPEPVTEPEAVQPDQPTDPAPVPTMKELKALAKQNGVKLPFTANTKPKVAKHLRAAGIEVPGIE